MCIAKNGRVYVRALRIFKILRHMCQTLARGSNLARSVITIGPRDHIKCAFELARRMCRKYYKSRNALLACWRAVDIDKRFFFLLTVINRHATVTSAKLISPSTKMAKRKMDNRSFQDRWEADLFTSIKDRTVCLVCGANVAATQEYNIGRHYETKHYEKYKDLDVKQKRQKGAGDEKKSGFSANYVHESKIKKGSSCKGQLYCGSRDSKISRLFDDGEFVKKCMVKVCDIVCPDEKQDFLNVSLSRNTVAERVCVSFPQICINN